MKKIIISFIAILLFANLGWADTFVAGKDYTVINANAPKQKQVKVIEFFNYGCPWCDYIENQVQAWLKTKPSYVDFDRVPLTFEQGWVSYARAYYLAKALSIEPKITPKLFVAIHGKDDKAYHDLSSTEAMTAFFVKNGVKKSLAQVTFAGNSPSIEAQVQYGTILMKQYKIMAIPAFVIAGKYGVNLGQAKNPKRFFAILNYLIQKAHAA